MYYHYLIYLATRSLPPPPNLLRNLPEEFNSVTIAWSQPDTTIVFKYRVTIVGTSYSEELSCTENNCTYTIEVDGSIVMFNTSYTVEVTTIDVCGLESSAENISIHTNVKKGKTGVSLVNHWLHLHLVSIASYTCHI